MQQEIATILKSKIFDLPFVDLIAGLAQPIQQADLDENNERRKVVFPMAYDVTDNSETQPNCRVGKERDLVPDSSRKSIFYFEDQGTRRRTGSGRPGSVAMQTNIRLVGWINKQKLVGNDYSQIQTYINSAIMGRLIRANPINHGNIKRLTITLGGFPKADGTLFSQYSYDETIRQFLMPPYECTGIDFVCKYEVSDHCLQHINFEGGSQC